MERIEYWCRNRQNSQRFRQVFQAYRELTSLRGPGCIFGVVRQSVLRWPADQVEQLPSLVEGLLPGQAGDILELDDLEAFVYLPDNERWLWTALCRRTRQIAAFVFEDRSAATCQRLGQAIPPLIFLPVGLSFNTNSVFHRFGLKASVPNGIRR